MKIKIVVTYLTNNNFTIISFFIYFSDEHDAII